jgi:hypothetical protein
MRKYISATVTTGSAGEFTTSILSGTGATRKRVFELWWAQKSAAATMVDDVLAYLDTEKLVDVPVEHLWGVPAASVDMSRSMRLPVDIIVETNSLLKVGVRSDAGTHAYMVTAVYEDI